MIKVLMIPSFYAICGFVIPLFFYFLRLIPWDTPSYLTIMVFAIFSLANITSFSFSCLKLTPVSLKRISKFHSSSLVFGGIDVVFLYISVFLGFIGYLLYYIELLQIFGGVESLINAFVQETQSIRLAEVDTIGTQLTYFGWIGCCVISYGIAGHRLAPKWLSIILINLILSLGYLDRVKPLTILVYSFVGYFVGSVVLSGGTSRRLLYKIGGGLVVSVLGFYFGVALLIGKIQEASVYGDTVLPPALADFYYYATSGYAYFDKILTQDGFASFQFDIFFYPVVKLLAAWGLADQPPTQVLDFLLVPLPTNVATGLEPIYSSFGGYGLILLGALLPFVFDGIAFLAYTWKSIFWVVVLATLSWSGVFLFFTARFVSAPFYVVLVYALFAVVAGAIFRSGCLRKSQDFM